MRYGLRYFSQFLGIALLLGSSVSSVAAAVVVDPPSGAGIFTITYDGEYFLGEPTGEYFLTASSTYCENVGPMEDMCDISGSTNYGTWMVADFADEFYATYVYGASSSASSTATDLWDLTIRSGGQVISESVPGFMAIGAILLALFCALAFAWAIVRAVDRGTGRGR